MTDDYATVTVTVEREIRVPVDVLGEDLLPAEISDRAGDWFWTHWREALANEPGPEKADVSVESVVAPRSAYKNDDGDRICTECGASVEDECYELWLFHTCRDCAQDGGDET